MSGRVLIWVQHLLGIGHFMRAKLVAEALADSGMEVLLLSGGLVPTGLTINGVRLVQLPAVRAKDELFDELVDLQGEAVTPGFMDARRVAVLDVFHAFKPDCVITETFPFGRRLVQAEVLSLIGAVKTSARKLKLVASIRDVLQRPRKPERAQAMVDLASRHYDCILVHADPAIVRAEEFFPEMAQVRDLLKYTGYICRGKRVDGPVREEVIVSAGGGAVGQRLVETAEKARALSALKDRPWTIAMGPLSESEPMSLGGLSKVRTLPDFAERLPNAAASISQAGYNTIAEVLHARTPSVVVPFETDREQEQISRAKCFERLGLLEVLRDADLAPLALAQAIDRAYLKKMPAHEINLDGQQGTVRAVQELLAT